MEACFGGIARWWLPRQPTLQSVVVPTTRLTAPLTVVHLSDLHCASWTRADYIEATVAAALALEPDLILWTGDFFHSDPRHMARIMPLFAPLHRAAPTFAVLGNHDFDTDLTEALPRLEATGMEFLRGEFRTLSFAGGRVLLGGIDDYQIKGRDMPAAFFGQPREIFRLLLSHQPDYLFRLRPDSVDLMLSGHLHGGQIVFPVVGPLYLPSPRGRVFLGEPVTEHEGNRVHTNLGLGYTLMPVRLNCPPSMSVVRLAPVSPETR